MAHQESTLILLTNTYPLSRGEEFLENEIDHVGRAFDRVVIIPIQAGPNDVQTRAIPGNAQVMHIARTSHRDLNRLLTTARGLLRLPPTGVDWAEARHQPRLLVSDAHFEGRAQAALDGILAKLPSLRLTPESHVTIYSFWLHITARTATLLADQLRAQGVTMDRVISRAHRYDLYPSASPRHHIPERRLLLQSLDGICPVSEQGTRELRTTWPQYAGKIHTRYLGTSDPGPTAHCRRDPFTIVSCAHLVPVKRMIRMPAILARVRASGIDAHWTHLGDGPQMDTLREEVTVHRVTDAVTLLGHVDNTQVMATQRDLKPSVFVNLSSSEGLPVSMMEVASLGIPIIATGVGGVGEIVSSDNGHLLPAEFTDAQASDALVQLARLSEDEYQHVCQASRQVWEAKFRASVVYPEFCREVLGGR